MNAAELREQAARAERLAWAVCDTATAERLMAMSQEYRRHAEEMEAQSSSTGRCSSVSRTHAIR